MRRALSGVFVVSIVSAAAWAAPMGTAFVYQGQLKISGVPVSGTADATFSLWTDATGGSQVGSTVTATGVSAVNGLFTVTLDFGAGVFSGEARWLQIAVRSPSGSGSYVTLSPRQCITATPYALYGANGGSGGLTLPYSGSATSGGTALDITNNGTGYAVRGTAQASAGVVGETANTNGYPGVWGKSTGTGPGVAGTASGSSLIGVQGSSSGAGAGIGVFGLTPSTNGKGVSGEATATSGINYGVYGKTNSASGYAGYFDGRGYFSGNVAIGVTNSTPNALNVVSAGDPPQLYLEQNATNNWARIRMGVTGSTKWDLSVGGGASPAMNFFNGSSNVMTLGYNGNVGIGTASPQQKLHVAGIGQFDLPSGSVSVSTPGGNPGLIAYAQNGHRRDIVFQNDRMRLLVGNSGSPPSVGLDILESGRTVVKTLEITGGSDLSEPFDVRSADKPVEPGMVVCIDPESPGRLVLSRKAYDRTVAGIISGAGGVNPGLMMGQKGSSADGAHPVALTGRVYCYVDATAGAVEPGDLLTTSATPGHAMKVKDHQKAQGAILGKAMSGLEKGKGLVLVLVTLQ